MGYNIEISIHLMKQNDLSQIKKEIVDFALDCNCNHYYYIYEMEGKCKFPRNHCIIVVHFDDEKETDIFYCSLFLKKIKKIKDLHVECIYEDTVACKLLYASQYYLTTMEKDKAIKYNKNKRERSLSENDKIVLESIDKLGSSL